MESFAANSRACGAEHWKLQPGGMEQPTTPSQVRGPSLQWDPWEFPVLSISFSRGRGIKDDIKPSLHRGSTHFQNLFLVSGKAEKVLLICVDWGGGKSALLLFIVLHS